MWKDKVIEGDTMEYLSFEDLQKVELKVGQIAAVSDVAKSDKLLNLKVDFGETEETVLTGNALIDEEVRVITETPIKISKFRTVLAGIAKSFTHEQLVGKQFLFVTNLAPRKMMGIMSEGMILAVGDSSDKLSIFSPSGIVLPGVQAK